jgi:hypothetical protein
MESVLEIWQENKRFFQEKGVQQIIALCGDGRLRDHSTTSSEFRELLENVPSLLLSRYADECLSSSFDNNGFALQDIVNEIGSRLSFEVQPGLYRGRSGAIGFDGIWSASDGYQLVIEVKTTDTYRINLDTLASYRSALIDRSNLQKDSSSILIVVGRQDTGDLEAQIRGSRHAWDIRLLSVDALLKLMTIRESLTDVKTAQQIAEILKPMEYTRLDQLVEIMFSTSEDLQAEVPAEEELAELASLDQSERATPANFHDECIERVSSYLGVSLIKEGRNRYTNPDKTIGISCAVSKEYPRSNQVEYWYAFHPSQRKYLSQKETSYVCYGCGSPDKVLLLPSEFLEPLLEHMWTTKNETRRYWHIHIFKTGSKWELGLGSSSQRVDITHYAIPLTLPKSPRS